MSESTFVKIPHCWKSHVKAHLLLPGRDSRSCGWDKEILHFVFSIEQLVLSHIALMVSIFLKVYIILTHIYLLYSRGSLQSLIQGFLCHFHPNSTNYHSEGHLELEHIFFLHNWEPERQNT